MGSKTILVVDNDPEFCHYLESIIPRDMQISMISSACQAVAIVRSGRCSAVVIAHALADGDGMQLLRQFKTLQPLLPVVFTTSHPSKSIILEAIHNGAFDVIEKPTSAGELSCMLERLGSYFSNPATMSTRLPGQMRSEKYRLATVLRTCAGKMKKWSFDCFDSSNNPQTLPNSRPILSTDKPTEVKESRSLALEVYFLGPLRALYAGREWPDWPGHKSKLLFAFLCYHHRQRISRDVLMDKFWPYASPESARNCLNVTMHALRRWLQQSQFPKEFIIFKDEYYFFHPDLTFYLDTEAFVSYFHQAQEIERIHGEVRALATYEAAAELYRGDFIEDHPYDSWTELERDNYREIFLSILNKISRLYSLDGKPERAIQLCQKILEKDGAREDIHRRIMHCHYRLGQRDKAMKQYFKCVKALKAELDAQPSTMTLQLFTQIKNNKEICPANKE